MEETLEPLVTTVDKQHLAEQLLAESAPTPGDTSG
jgi:hypothetical protein